MQTSRLALAGSATVAALSLAGAFLIAGTAAGQVPDPLCPEGSRITCTTCPPGNSNLYCGPDLVRARAKAEVLTPEDLVKLCADVRVHGLAAVRVALGHPYVDIIRLDGKTCDGVTPVVVVPIVPTSPTAPVVEAPAPQTVIAHLPVTH